ncbi:MAG TPA: hypothetical protein VE201_04405, partial [Nitrospirales bacterium]|nr:hypothetical protein [Nitrospirales bacterium]
MKQSDIRRIVAGVAVCLAVASPYVFGAEEGLGKDSLELQISGDGGTPIKETIPIHRVGSIRYFSAGIGLEERSAQYPSFPLKLVFVAGRKAYLSQVSVTITGQK